MGTRVSNIRVSFYLIAVSLALFVVAALPIQLVYPDEQHRYLLLNETALASAETTNMPWMKFFIFASFTFRAL